MARPQSEENFKTDMSTSEPVADFLQILAAETVRDLTASCIAELDSLFNFVK